MTSPVSAVEAIEKAQNRVQGMLRSIDQYRNGDPKAVADGSYAQVLYALTDYKHDILVLWAFAVDAARQAEALQREIAELRRLVENGQSFANQVRSITYRLNGQAYSSTVSELNQFDAGLRRARTLLKEEANAE